MFLSDKSSRLMLCTVSALALYASPFLSVTSQTAFAKTIEIGVDGAETVPPITKALQKRLSSKFKRISRAKKWSRGALVQYYADADYQPIWVDEKGPNLRAQSLLKVIGRADDYGLNPADYKLPTLNNMGEDGLSPSMLARIELEFSLAALKYIDTARNGRFEPTKLSRFMDGTKEKIDAVKALEKISSTSMIMGYLEGYHPSHPQYKGLKKKLAELRGNTGAEPKIIKIPVSGPTLKEGMLHPDTLLIRKRFNVHPPQQEGENLFDPSLYDKEVMAVVAKFQKSKGLKADGIAGRRTRMAMNAGQVSKKWRIEQILANMERWRWLPDQLGKQHIFVNIPEYKVRVFSEGKIIHQERIIVGKIANKTPFFSDEMEKVVFNPYWHVPQSIIANEMNYSVPRGYEGHYSNDGMLHVKQPPGPRNALGRVKFLFPNKHAVYLHDTPSKNLFNSKVRAFSHGCMRVRDPKRMAEVILSIGYKGSAEKIVNRHWRTLKNAQLILDKKIPVHVTYFTARVAEDGKVNYFNDVYKHDKRVVTVLNGGRVYLEPKQRIKSRKPRRDRYDSWGADIFGNDRYSRNRKVKRYKKKRYSSNFWGEPRKVKTRQPKRSRYRRRSSGFDPFGLGW